MRIFWVCPVVEWPRPNYWAPEMEVVRRTFVPMFACRWSITDAVRAVKYAVGVAEVNATQLAAINADAQITLFDESLLFTTFGSLPGTAKNKINTFCDNAGIARPALNEVLHDLWSRISVTVDFKTIDVLIAELNADLALMPPP